MYATLVFREFGAYTSDLWKVFVTLLAFGIKIVRPCQVADVPARARVVLIFLRDVIEVQGGLLTLHELYRDPRAGGDPRSKYRANRMGDLFKSLSTKLGVTIALTAFVLAAT